MKQRETTPSASVWGRHGTRISQNDIIRRRGSPDPFHQPSKARAVCATWPLLAISWSETCFLQFRDSSLQTCWDTLLGVECGVRQHQWVLRCLKMPFKHLSNLVLLSRGSNHQAKVVSYYLGDRLVHRQGDVVSFGLTALGLLSGTSFDSINSMLLKSSEFS